QSISMQRFSKKALKPIVGCLAILALCSSAPSGGSFPDLPGAGAKLGNLPHKPPDHWAFQPVRRPTPPTVKGGVRTDIDRFILGALEAHGYTLNPEADRATLIRRVSFDLIGLPPTLAEIEAFLNDRAPDAYERMVERYLASPHYGERWGKYWLDVAGY